MTDAVKLFCMCVDAAKPAFSVTAQPHQTIDDLNELVIAKTKLTQYSTQDIELFLAKRDSQWLSSKSEEVKVLGRGDAASVLDLLSEVLDPTAKISDVFTGSEDRSIHVLMLETVFAKKLLPSPLSAVAVPRTEERRKRWRYFNELTLQEVKRLKTDSSSNDVRAEEEDDDDYLWIGVNDAFSCERYSQERNHIPKDHTDFMYKYLKDFVVHAMDQSSISDGTTISLFLMPTLSMIYRQFDDARLEVNKTWQGVDVHANVRFNFILSRGQKKKLCILVAKKGNFYQGEAKAVVGCEAVADTTGMHVVYGIVTDFARWEIYRSSEESILHESCLIPHEGGVPDYAATVEVCEKIYALLSDDDDKENGEVPSNKQC